MDINGCIRILFLSASPLDENPLRVDQEYRDIQEQLKKSKFRDKFQLEHRPAVRKKDIVEAILDFEPHIVHFSGHGDQTGKLCFENENGETEEVSPKLLSEIFALCSDHVSCVLLNACYSRKQAEAIVKHIPFVIGMHGSIDDESAIAFSTGFYRAVMADKAIEKAFNFGLLELKLHDLPDQKKPVLHTKKNLEEGKAKWTLTLKANLDDLSEQQVSEIVGSLQQLVGGASLTLEKVASGSVKLFFKGSWVGYEYLKFLFQTDRLKTLNGIPIQSLEELPVQINESWLSEAPENTHNLDFSASPEIVWAIAEGERLTYGHLFNPTFAIETSLIDPLPHQRIAVYRYLLKEPRLRFLLADDAGAGKTIMAGLYIREMLSRRLIRRILIVPPAGLVGNWRREMKMLFNLPFRIVAGSEARSRNPFIGEDSDFLIVSIDTLAADRLFARLQESAVEPYDLVIFDEAHKLSADREPDLTIRKTNRYRLAEALAGANRDSQDERWHLDWSCRYLLLLTATPHMGRNYPYYFLWRLLQPDVLSTYEAFAAYPADARIHHFLRRTKEEMVKFDGEKLYPMRISDTLSYDLSQGDVSEQTLYDETTHYIQYFYNKARILNRSAARLAMSIFQRRLASSTYALMCSFERRLKKLDDLIVKVRSGEISESLDMQQAKLNKKADEVLDVLSQKTADEEEIIGNQEEHDSAEDEAMGGVAATSLHELETERTLVEHLLQLAKQVYDQGEESKLEKLREILYDPAYRNEKIIIFTEHRDTLNFLVSRFEGLGFTGRIARIYGGMPYTEREEQVEFFRKLPEQGGATYLIATDAAGEGINLQFCWLMINYDIPWNPARLEQRMGRIHRYGQKRDPVIILNIVAGKTREGKVIKTLLDKLENIRQQLQADKVFDVIGRVFEGISIKEYIERASASEEAADAITQEIEGRLTPEQVRALQVQEKKLYETGGDVKALLPELRLEMQYDELRRLLPGYIRRFIQRSAPLLGLELEGDLDGVFALKPRNPNALNPLWTVLETYPLEQRDRLTVYKPKDKEDAIFLHPGEPLFECFREQIELRFGDEALSGAIFIDPTAKEAYLFHIALVSIVRKADPLNPQFSEAEIVEQRLVGLKQWESDAIAEVAVEYLTLLKGGQGIPPQAIPLVAKVQELLQLAKAYTLQNVGERLVQTHRSRLLETLPERERFLSLGYDYQEAELLKARKKQREKANAGNSRAKAELTKVKERQQRLVEEREVSLTALKREPSLITVGVVTFLTHALVVPSSDPEERKRYDRNIEAIAMRVATAHEEAQGAVVRDVSTPELARQAGLTDYPGFDLLSEYSTGEKRAIEVKGRAGIGEVELTENEWVAACNLRGSDTEVERPRYWLYVVYDCASAYPRLLRVGDPFGKLIVRSKTNVVIGENEIFQAAEV
jgi:SNF2 family DNA or RNA helicase